MDVHEQDAVIRTAMEIFRALARYHRYRVKGLSRFPVEGPALVVVNHSLATYDVGLLGLAVYESTGRLMRCLGDRSLFGLPGIKDIVPRLGVVDAHPNAAQELLAEGEMVLVAPGGMREALRPHTERYQLQWSDRRGFARVALEAQAPVILAACPRADDVFTPYNNPVTEAIYKRLRLPFPIARGFGPTAIPRPIALTHHISDPIPPPEDQGEDSLNEFHRHLVDEMTVLMERGLSQRL